MNAKTCRVKTDDVNPNGSPQTIVLRKGHPQRAQAERLIELRYKQAFDCTLSAHYPLLIGVCNGRSIDAAAGLRCAKDERLFLENYLDQPIEVAVTRALGRKVEREEIVEIGNLAASGAGSTATLFAAMAEYAYASGARIAVATTTRQLRRAFRSLGFISTALAPASASRLGENSKKWGAYYDNDPIVVAGEIAKGSRAIRAVDAGAGA